jgi:hypothetical protein
VGNPWLSEHLPAPQEGLISTETFSQIVTCPYSNLMPLTSLLQSTLVMHGIKCNIRASCGSVGRENSSLVLRPIWIGCSGNFGTWDRSHRRLEITAQRGTSECVLTTKCYKVDELKKNAHQEEVGYTRNTHNILAGKPKRKGTLKRICIHLFQDRFQWLAPVNTIMKILVP